MGIDGGPNNSIGAKFDSRDVLKEKRIEVDGEPTVDASLVDKSVIEQMRASWNLHDREDLAVARQRVEQTPDDRPDHYGDRSVGEVMSLASSSGAVREEQLVVGEQKILVRYLAKDALHPAWGYSSGNVVAVREDLPPKVRRFVLAHEVYHCTDKQKWGGWIGREIRANVMPALKDPIGALAALVYNFNLDRIKFYIRRFREDR